MGSNVDKCYRQFDIDLKCESLKRLHENRPSLSRRESVICLVIFTRNTDLGHGEACNTDIGHGDTRHTDIGHGDTCDTYIGELYSRYTGG